MLRRILAAITARRLPLRRAWPRKPMARYRRDVLPAPSRDCERAPLQASGRVR